MQEIKYNTLPEPWYLPVNDGMRQALLIELKKEIIEGHQLWGYEFELIAKRDDRDDILVRLLGTDDQVAQIHLTWSSPGHDTRWPQTLISSFPNWFERESLNAEYL